MGQLISLTDRLAQRAQERAAIPHGRPAFFFALDCPVSYLVAERVERNFGDIAWVPTLAAFHQPARVAERLRRARIEAAAHRLVLLEPDHFPFDARPAARAAVYAASTGYGGGFATAAMRMAFAGGFDLSDPDVIAEAAAAAGMSVDQALGASEDSSHDATLEATARSLSGRGIWETPVIVEAGEWIPGFAALAQNLTPSASRTPLAQSAAFTAPRASALGLPAEPA
jgi:2-hydroxychromene-2-carboxylate isomerase